jgi:hypothetical protein
MNRIKEIKKILNHLMNMEELDLLKKTGEEYDFL